MGSTKASGRAMWAALALSLLGGCQAACPFPGQHAVTRLELFFGRDIPGGGRWATPPGRILRRGC